MGTERRGSQPAKKNITESRFIFHAFFVCKFKTFTKMKLAKKIGAVVQFPAPAFRKGGDESWKELYGGLKSMQKRNEMKAATKSIAFKHIIHSLKYGMHSIFGLVAIRRLVNHTDQTLVKHNTNTELQSKPKQHEWIKVITISNEERVTKVWGGTPSTTQSEEEERRKWEKRREEKKHNSNGKFCKCIHKIPEPSRWMQTHDWRSLCVIWNASGARWTVRSLY